MNVYEFTRFEADYTSKVKAQGYDLGTIEFLIRYNNPDRNFEEEAEYKEARDVFLDVTMSCNEAEAVQWMEYFVVNAIAYGIATKSRDWMPKFLAANDLYTYLLSQRCTGVHSK